MKKIMLLLLSLALIGGIYGYLQWNKPHQDVAKRKEDLSIVANELFIAFEQDEVKANSLYLDKLIHVNGVIKGIENNDAGDITVILVTENDMSSLLCNLDPLVKHNINALKAGQNVHLKGFCSGFLMDVVLDRCILITN